MGCWSGRQWLYPLQYSASPQSVLHTEEQGTPMCLPRPCPLFPQKTLTTFSQLWKLKRMTQCLMMCEGSVILKALIYVSMALTIRTLSSSKENKCLPSVYSVRKLIASLRGLTQRSRRERVQTLPRALVEKMVPIRCTTAQTRHKPQPVHSIEKPGLTASAKLGKKELTMRSQH